MKNTISFVLALMLTLFYIPSAVYANDQTDAESDASVTIENDIIMTAHDAYIPASDGQTLRMSKYDSLSPYTYLSEMQVKDTGCQERNSVFYFKIPQKGAVVFSMQKGINIWDNYVNITGVDVDLNYVSIQDLSTNERQYIYTSPKAGTMKVELMQKMYNAGNGYTTFGAIYYPDEIKTIKASSSWKGYTHGAYGVQTKITKFKVKAPAKGYLELDMSDASGAGIPVSFKTTGFKQYETAENGSGIRYIGVKKGTYTFSVKTSSPFYDVKVRFKKIKEGSYGTSKSKAKIIKRGSARKGLIITNAKVSQKTHWYKFKLKSNSNVSLQINSLLNGGGIYGGLLVTVYGKSGKIKSFTIRPDTQSVTYSLSSKNLYGKLKKGTYYIKIKSKDAGNGYFTVKWS